MSNVNVEHVEGEVVEKENFFKKAWNGTKKFCSDHADGLLTLGTVAVSLAMPVGLGIWANKEEKKRIAKVEAEQAKPEYWERYADYYQSQADMCNKEADRCRKNN